MKTIAGYWIATTLFFFSVLALVGQPGAAVAQTEQEAGKLEQQEEQEQEEETLEEK